MIFIAFDFIPTLVKGVTHLTASCSICCLNLFSPKIQAFTVASLVAAKLKWSIIPAASLHLDWCFA
jgi:hypothetical protein